MYLLDEVLRRVVEDGVSSNAGVVLFGYRRLPAGYGVGRRKFSGSREKSGCSYDYRKLGDLLDGWFADEANLRYKVSLEDIAYRFGVSRTVMLNYFRVVLKKDFRLYRTEKRIAAAKEILLAEEDSEVVRIAERLGFRDKSNFHRQFKKQVGCTPGQWRLCGGHIEVCGQ